VCNANCTTRGMGSARTRTSPIPATSTSRMSSSMASVLSGCSACAQTETSAQAACEGWQGRGRTPGSLQGEYRAGGRVHTPSRAAPPVGRHREAAPLTYLLRGRGVGVRRGAQRVGVRVEEASHTHTHLHHQAAEVRLGHFAAPLHIERAEREAQLLLRRPVVLCEGRTRDGIECGYERCLSEVAESADESRRGAGLAAETARTLGTLFQMA